MMLSRFPSAILRVSPFRMISYMSTTGLKGFNDAESARENLYFGQEDKKNLNKILQKIRAATKDLEAEKDAIKWFVLKYKVSDEDLVKLLDWKHHAH